MADSIVPTGVDIMSRYNTGSTRGRDIYTNPADYDKELALYEDKGTLSFTDMLGLMVAQFQYQTMDNQASTTDMMNQLVQMSSMQAMTEMSNIMSYSASLVGKTVTVGQYDETTKETIEIVGVVQGTGTYNGQQVIYLDNGKGYFLSEIMAVGKLPPKPEDPDAPDPDNPDAGDSTDKEEVPDAEDEGKG